MGHEVFYHHPSSKKTGTTTQEIKHDSFEVVTHSRVFLFVGLAVLITKHIYIYICIWITKHIYTYNMHVCICSWRDIE